MLDDDHKAGAYKGKQQSRAWVTIRHDSSGFRRLSWLLRLFDYLGHTYWNEGRDIRMRCVNAVSRCRLFYLQDVLVTEMVYILSRNAQVAPLMPLFIRRSPPNINTLCYVNFLFSLSQVQETIFETWRVNNNTVDIGCFSSDFSVFIPRHMHIRQNKKTLMCIFILHKHWHFCFGTT